MISDDAELTCMVAQALIGSGGNVDSFRRRFAWQLRLWLLTLPAGIGLATLRAILRLWIGFGPERSGVFSAGNGPAIRAAIIGAAVDDDALLSELVRASSRITHTDLRAEGGALAVALAARMARQGAAVSGALFVSRLRSVLGRENGELIALMEKVADSAGRGESTESFAESLGLAKGVSGYVCHTVPVALHAWLAHQGDYRSAVGAVIRCGGDADSTAAIVGGIVGASVGKEGIPDEWRDRVMEWPRSVAWMESLGAQLDTSMRDRASLRPLRLPLLGVLLRNLVFLGIVLFHGFRRLLPPY